MSGSSSADAVGETTEAHPRRAIVHHGTALPDRDWAATVTADLVLQPFHGIVRDGAFAEWFPRARRFVYVNPTAVDRKRRPDVPDELVRFDSDDRWELPRLEQPAALDFAVADAVTIARLPGVDGLFVDDLDLLLPDLRDVALSYLDRVSAEAAPAYFVNRGFDLLDWVRGIEAVLVEDLDRDRRRRGASAWIADTVLPAVRLAAAAGVRVHRVEYGPARARLVARRAVAELEGLCASSARLSDEHLDDWQEWV